MTFEEILDQAMAMLQRRGRLTYGTLKWQFQLDDAALEDFKDELIYGQRLAVDEEEGVLVWRGVPVSAPPPAPTPPPTRPSEPARVPLAYTPAHLAEKILTSRSALEGERKQVTVLFADLKGSMQRSHGVPVQIRVGLHSGVVVVRAIDSSLHMDYTAVGQTTHLAARMEQMAKPGSVLTAGETLRLAEGFVQVTALGPVAVKGLADSVEVFEPVGATSTRTRRQAFAARGLTRFVGRQAEFEALRQALERAGTSHGQVVAVIGEPVVGKSRDDRDDGRKVREKLTGKLLTLDTALGPTLPAFLRPPIRSAACARRTRGNQVAQFIRLCSA